MRLVNSGVDQTELDDALVAATTAVSNSLNDEQGRWLLDSAHSDSVCEWPLTFNSGNILYHYIIDRSGHIRFSGLGFNLADVTAVSQEVETLLAESVDAAN